MSQYENFYAAYYKIEQNQRHRFIPSKDTYDAMMIYLVDNVADEAISKATLKNWKARFSIRQMEDGKNVLYHGQKQVVHQDGLFGVLYTAHIKTGHGGRDAMFKELQGNHGISKDTITIYLKTCGFCELKKARVRKSLVTNPILEKDYAERYQADCIDLQASADGPYKWILVVQDHFTKYVHLRPLPSKEALPIVEHMRRIFAEFGPCCVLHTDNGREFKNKHLEALCADWNVKFVHGLPRKSSTQGSVERANQDIENIIMTWESHFKRNDWADNLPIFQLMKNNRYHRSCGKSPYEAVFGRRPHSVPMWTTEEVFVEIEERAEDGAQTTADEATEDELEENDENDGPEVAVEVEVASPSTADEVTEDELEENEENDENDGPDPEVAVEVEIASPEQMEKRQARIGNYRQWVQKNQLKAAGKMLESTANRLATVDVGKTVRIPVDQWDRSKIDGRNVLGVVLDENNGYYTLGTKSGVLQQKFVRSGFEPAASDHMSIDDVPSSSTTKRTTATDSSQHGGQGFNRCNCKTGCGPRCSCKKAGQLCNSYCHKSLSCNNK